MAKTIKYKFLSAEINQGTEENPKIRQIFLEKTINCQNEAAFKVNYAIAEKEAAPGTIRIIEDSTEEEIEYNAQDDTDAMLVDHEYRLTLLELGLNE